MVKLYGVSCKGGYNVKGYINGNKITDKINLEEYVGKKMYLTIAKNSSNFKVIESLVVGLPVELNNLNNKNYNNDIFLNVKYIGKNIDDFNENYSDILKLNKTVKYSKNYLEAMINNRCLDSNFIQNYSFALRDSNDNNNNSNNSYLDLIKEDYTLVISDVVSNKMDYILEDLKKAYNKINDKVVVEDKLSDKIKLFKDYLDVVNSGLVD